MHKGWDFRLNSISHQIGIKFGEYFYNIENIYIYIYISIVKILKY